MTAFRSREFTIARNECLLIANHFRDQSNFGTAEIRSPIDRTNTGSFNSIEFSIKQDRHMIWMFRKWGMSVGRWTLDDVERISKGKASKAKTGSRKVPHRLQAGERTVLTHFRIWRLNPCYDQCFLPVTSFPVRNLSLLSSFTSTWILFLFVQLCAGIRFSQEERLHGSACSVSKVSISEHISEFLWRILPAMYFHPAGNRILTPRLNQTSYLDTYG